MNLVSSLVKKKKGTKPHSNSNPLPSCLCTSWSIYAQCRIDNNKTETNVSDEKCRNKPSFMADFIANSAPASKKREERKRQRPSRRNGNVPNVPASMSSPSTVLPLAVRPTALAWEIIRKNLSILWWSLPLTSVHSKNFMLFMNEPRKHFQSFQKFLLGVLVLIPGTYPPQHQAHKCSSLSTHRPAFMVFLR